MSDGRRQILDRTPKPCACPLRGHKHGTDGAYRRDACRCEPCTEAHRVAGAAYRKSAYLRRLTYSAVGSRRRILALGRLGYSRSYIAARLGCEKKWLWQIVHERSTVFAATHHRIAALYAELWDRPCREGSWLRAQRQAERCGGRMPLEWDDIDDPAERPAAAQHSRAEQREDRLDDVEWLVRTGSPIEEALERVGWTVAAFKRAAQRSHRAADLRRVIELSAA